MFHIFIQKMWRIQDQMQANFTFFTIYFMFHIGKQKLWQIQDMWKWMQANFTSYDLFIYYNCGEFKIGESKCKQPLFYFMFHIGKWQIQDKWKKMQAKFSRPTPPPQILPAFILM